MSTASHAASGHLSFGGLMSRLLFILVLWAGLVYGTLHYVGYVIPKEYQLSQARSDAAETAAKAAAIPEPATPAAAPATASAAPAAPAASAASASVAPSTAAASPTVATPALGSHEPAVAPASATPAASAGSAKPAAAPAGTANKPLPKDVLLAGFNRTALTNVARFYSIVISFFCVGAIILQIFKYKHVEEESAH